MQKPRKAGSPDKFLPQIQQQLQGHSVDMLGQHLLQQQQLTWEQQQQLQQQQQPPSQEGPPPEQQEQPFLVDAKGKLLPQ